MKDLAKTNQGLIQIDPALIERFEKTISDCLTIAGKTAQSISESVTIANGLNQMREFFKNKDLEKLITSMQDSKLGFLTDKPKGKTKWNARAQKMVDVVPYSYTEITEAIIPMLLEGYRFTGNEINIISGQAMPVKAGKHRKIIEYDGLDGFIHTVGSPTKEGDKETGIAKMKCQAKWIIEDKEYSIGYGDDICIIAVEYDKWSGLDKLIGLAESKLYSRVLTRILGKFVSEGEISNTTVIPDQQKTESAGSRIKEKFAAQSKNGGSQESTPSQKLAEMVADPQYKTAINSIVSDPNNQITEVDLSTSNDGNADDVIKAILHVKGFEDSEKNDTQSDNPEDYFGD